MRATSSNDEQWSTHWQCYHLFFCLMIEMIAKGQRGKRSHSNMSRKKIFVRLLIFRDIGWEDSQDLEEPQKFTPWPRFEEDKLLQQKHHLNRIFKEQKLEKYSLSLHGGRLLGLYYYYYYYYLLSFCFVYNSSLYKW